MLVDLRVGGCRPSGAWRAAVALAGSPPPPGIPFGTSRVSPVQRLCHFAGFVTSAAVLGDLSPSQPLHTRRCCLTPSEICDALFAPLLGPPPLHDVPVAPRGGLLCSGFATLPCLQPLPRSLVISHRRSRFTRGAAASRHLRSVTHCLRHCWGPPRSTTSPWRLAGGSCAAALPLCRVCNLFRGPW